MAILIADDQPDDLERWKGSLDELRVPVVGATSYAEAEKRLSEGGVDVAVIDLYLEDSSQPDVGLQLAESFGKRLPVIILTAETAWTAADKAHQKKACHFVAKAAGPQALLTAVKDAMRRRVFVAHGLDLRFRDEVRDFLRSRQLWPIILQEEPGKGLTIIEKLEEFSNVGFAVVLFSPDDAGGQQVRSGSGGVAGGATEVKVLRPRPRQNVVFELGVFVGKLGRKKTVVLCQDCEIEILSNYGGVEYIATSGDWRELLVREMKAGGVHVG